MSAGDLLVVDDGRYGLSIIHRVFVGYDRHGITCRGGRWRVILCIDGVENYDAVMDDFGNLVRVGA